MSHEPASGEVISCVDDLIFATKIGSTAKSLGLSHRNITGSAVREVSGAVIVVVDLNAVTFDPVKLVEILKARIPSPTVIGFLSHTQERLAEAAALSGCDEVMPRSRFVRVLPDLLLSWRDKISTI
jgi:hypothetical protein